MTPAKEETSVWVLSVMGVMSAAVGMATTSAVSVTSARVKGVSNRCKVTLSVIRKRHVKLYVCDSLPALILFFTGL